MAPERKNSFYSFREKAALLSYRAASLLAFALAFPLSPVLARCSRRVKDGYNDFLGKLQPQSDTRAIWVHGVSMGESMVAMGFIKEIRRRFPHQKILFTTTHPDVLANVKKSRLVEEAAYFPLDNPLAMKRAFSRWRPAAVFVVETDFWPEFSWNCRINNVPLILINGRISEKLAGFYTRFKGLAGLIFNSYRLMLVQSECDADRLVQCGANSSLINVLGNMKADLTADPPSVDDSFMGKWLAGRRCLIFGSLHPSEFAVMQKVIKNLAKDSAVLIAPRNPANASVWQQKLVEDGLKASLRSSLPDSSAEIMLLDTMGELAALYSHAEVAFVGGSINAGVGGHNPLEVICHKVPLIMGSDFRNFADIVDQLKKVGGISIIESPDQISEHIKKLMSDGTAAEKQAASAFEVLTAGRGVLEKTVKAVSAFLPAAEVIEDCGV